MSLANFFQRSATAASQVLSRFNLESFKTVLEAAPVGIVYDAAAATSPEGRATLDLCVRLLARLYPQVAIAPLSRDRSNLRSSLVRLAQSINPDLTIQPSADGARAVLVVGDTVVAPARRPIYIGSDGWTCRLSTTRPVGSGRSENPFGAGAAACFGAANLFRLIFGEYLEGGVLDEDLTLSLFDYDRAGRAPRNPILRATNLGESHLVGLGAIGHGAVWALSQLQNLTGRLHLVDPELVDLSNLQRYVLATQRHADKAEKVRLCKAALRQTGLTVRAHRSTWAEYVARQDEWRFERVALALDSARDRIAVQASLPRWIVNAWTQPGDLGCSRHDFLGEHACLMCMYLPSSKRKDFDTIVAEAVGLLPVKNIVTGLLYTNQPVGRPFIEMVAKALTIAVEPLLPFQDKPLRTFYSEAICGGVVLRLKGEANDGATAEAPAQVPMSFQSALAGIMLAGELVIHAGGMRTSPPPVSTKIDLLRPLGVYLSFDDQKHPSGTCICQDVDYIEAYRQKYA